MALRCAFKSGLIQSAVVVLGGVYAATTWSKLVISVFSSDSIIASITKSLLLSVTGFDALEGEQIATEYISENMTTYTRVWAGLGSGIAGLLVSGAVGIFTAVQSHPGIATVIIQGTVQTLSTTLGAFTASFDLISLRNIVWTGVIGGFGAAIASATGATK